MMVDLISSYIDISQILLYGLLIFGIVLLAASFAVKFIPGLSLLPIFNFIPNTKIVIGIFLIIFSYFVYAEGVDNAKKVALAEYNNKQLQEDIKEKEALLVVRSKLIEDQASVIQKLSVQNKVLSDKVSSISVYLNSDEAKKSNRPSSDVLKNTIKMLSKSQPQ
jgi:hypothetical protein